MFNLSPNCVTNRYPSEQAKVSNYNDKNIKIDQEEDILGLNVLYHGNMLEFFCPVTRQK